jgi:hypothetical protein
MRIERIGTIAIALVLLGVVLYRGTATGFVTSPFVDPAPEPGCTDGDIGITPEIASKASVGGIELLDTCADGAALFEAVCSNGKAKFVYLDCSHDFRSGSSCIQEGPNARCV